MDKQKQVTVDLYRKKHKRCKTCVHACQKSIGWDCRATGSSYEGKVGWTVIKGCFCKLYQPHGTDFYMQEWVSVKERLPEVDTNVLVITTSGSFKVAKYNIYKNGTLILWMTNDGLGEKAITHWMPLPEPPKMKGGAEE